VTRSGQNGRFGFESLLKQLLPQTVGDVQDLARENPAFRVTVDDGVFTDLFAKNILPLLEPQLQEVWTRIVVGLH